MTCLILQHRNFIVFLSGHSFTVESTNTKVAVYTAVFYKFCPLYLCIRKSDFQFINISGKLIGRYYDAEGQPTPYYQQVKKLITKAKKTKQEERIEKLSYPPCNSEWSHELGSRVWCTKMRYIFKIYIQCTTIYA